MLNRVFPRSFHLQISMLPSLKAHFRLIFNVINISYDLLSSVSTHNMEAFLFHTAETKSVKNHSTKAIVTILFFHCSPDWLPLSQIVHADLFKQDGDRLQGHVFTCPVPSDQMDERREMRRRGSHH